MRILVCGSRTWADFRRIYDALDAESLAARARFEEAPPVGVEYEFVVIHGAARGADMIASSWVEAQPEIARVSELRFPANWKEFGKAAGMIRNKQMLAEGRPDRVLAFWDGMSRGTANMVALAQSAGVPVEIVNL